MNAASYLLAVVVAGAAILTLGPKVGSSDAAFATEVRAEASPAPTVSSSPSAPSAPSPVSAEATAETVVDTKNFAYVPATVTVAAGSTVRFKNSDSLAHTVTADDGTFDSKNMSEGQSWSHVFAKAGTYKYYCTYHRYMHGLVVVK